ncbi:MAG: undecaprenyl-diphosphatase [Candidatus Sedimenticola endophacoides]|nr:MAG: undecaprenyl-diphosphatase [Candidatus Sedimenticola endophacoides]
MDLLQIAALAIVQGLTEFLPISSSAHLILAPLLLDYRDQGLAFDVAVHVGSLLAVVSYFRVEILSMARDFFASLGPKGVSSKSSRMVWMIVLSTLPILFFGKLFMAQVQGDLRSMAVIAAATVVFALPLFWWDRHGAQERDEFSLGWREALIIGLFQALALIPGTSRSGITITAALMLGLTRAAAARFSFLLSIPTILMSGGLVTLELLLGDQGIQGTWGDLLLGAVLAFLSALGCIHLFLRLIERIGMLPFVIYRLLLGTLLFLLIL